MSRVLEEQSVSDAGRLPGEGKRACIIGAPCSFGASIAGVDLGPAAMRIARLRQRIAGLGYEVRDRGDLRMECPAEPPPAGEKLRYLPEIKTACELLATGVRESLEAGELPIVLGGDHSIAIGSVSGVASFYRERKQPVGLIWFDAHADMNTPETTPSGNIHGMPLAALFGRGAPELTGIEGFSPKLDPRFCAHIGARDVDQGERELIRKLGMRFFTMREIDERGMSACVDEAIHIASQAPAGYHVTLDVDALDPGDAPGSGTVVRGGLTYREAHLAMEKIADAGGALALEVVEINTALDINNRTAELGVELILSALGKSIL
jgi:arginase